VLFVVELCKKPKRGGRLPKMTTSGYLEHYLDSLDNLPGEVRRNFNLMYDLDDKNKSILQEVDAASDEYLRKVNDLSPDKRRAEMEKIQKLFKDAKNYGDEKVGIAIQTYEMVDKHIRRLDGDLAKFEAELREKGRLSQTDDSEEEDEEEDQQVNKKKRGKNDSKNKNDPKGKKGQKGRQPKDEVGKDQGSSKKKANKKDGKKEKVTLSSQPLLQMPQEIIDMPVDPNEPTYCVCQQVSYGEMIGCDNNECPIEWFHFGCMQLTTKPKGKWYCPKCIVLFKKKKGGS